MRMVWIVLLCWMAEVPPARADETPGDVAGKVRAAFDIGDMDTMRTLASASTHDPWLVADALCLGGSIDAAFVYARPVERQDTARLPAYLNERRQTGHDLAIREAASRARGARSSKEGETAPNALSALDALKALEALAGRGDIFGRVLAERSRGSVLSRLDRAAEASEAFLSAGRLAEQLGWLYMAAEVYYQAGLRAHAVRNYEGMSAAWARLLAVHQGRGDVAGVGLR